MKTVLLVQRSPTRINQRKQPRCSVYHCPLKGIQLKRWRIHSYFGCDEGRRSAGPLKASLICTFTVFSGTFERQSGDRLGFLSKDFGHPRCTWRIFRSERVPEKLASRQNDSCIETQR